MELKLKERQLRRENKHDEAAALLGRYFCVQICIGSWDIEILSCRFLISSASIFHHKIFSKP